VIALVRVDNRLLHGQILETWIPRLGIREVVVADDDAARSDLARAAMTLCVPPDLPVRVVPVEVQVREAMVAGVFDGGIQAEIDLAHGALPKESFDLKSAKFFKHEFTWFGAK